MKLTIENIKKSRKKVGDLLKTGKITEAEAQATLQQLDAAGKTLTPATKKPKAKTNGSIPENAPDNIKKLLEQDVISKKEFDELMAWCRQSPEKPRRPSKKAPSRRRPSTIYKDRVEQNFKTFLDTLKDPKKVQEAQKEFIRHVSRIAEIGGLRVKMLMSELDDIAQKQKETLQKQKKGDKQKKGKQKKQEGGPIHSQYTGRMPKEVWHSWTKEQREHFLIDHWDASTHGTEVLQGKNLKDIAAGPYEIIPPVLRKELDYHIGEGQYAKGGPAGKYPTDAYTKMSVTYRTPSGLGGSFNVKYIGKEGEYYIYENIHKDFEGQKYKFTGDELPRKIALPGQSIYDLKKQ